jgi:hypothetical protein
VTHATYDAGVRRQLYLSASLWRLTEESGVRTATIRDIKKQKNKLFKFRRDSDNQNTVENRETVHRTKNENVDSVLIERIRQRRGENMSLAGLFGHGITCNICYAPKIRKSQNFESVSVKGFLNS